MTLLSFKRNYSLVQSDKEKKISSTNSAASDVEKVILIKKSGSASIHGLFAFKPHTMKLQGITSWCDSLKEYTTEENSPGFSIWVQML